MVGLEDYIPRRIVEFRPWWGEGQREPLGIIVVYENGDIKEIPGRISTNTDGSFTVDVDDTNVAVEMMSNHDIHYAPDISPNSITGHHHTTTTIPMREGIVDPVELIVDPVELELPPTEEEFTEEEYKVEEGDLKEEEW